MRASSKRALSIGLSALFLLGSFVVYGSLIRPLYDDIQKIRASLSAAQTLFDNQKNATEQVNKTFLQMKNAASVREAISQALPVGPNMTQALHQIESVIRANKLKIDSLTIKEAAAETNKQILAKRLGKLDVNFSVSGEYESLRDFLKDLESNIRVTNVTNFEFSSLSASEKVSSSVPIYTLQLVAQMYYQEN